MNKNSLKIFITLSVITFIANYFYLNGFGFYEDDYYHITVHIKNNLSEVLSFAGIRLTNWFKGHPFAFFPSAFTFLGMRLGGIQALYILGYLILVLNSFLMYKILKKINPASEVFAVAGAIMFCLFPANSTKIFLTYSFTLQTSLTFLLVSSLFYLSDKKILSYIVITGALFSYEPAFMVFFGVPLLKLKWDKDFRIELLKHMSVLFSILMIVLLIRYFMVEERIIYVTRNFPGFANDLVYGIVFGSVNVIRSFISSPLASIRDFSFTFLPFILISILLIIFSFHSNYKAESKSNGNNINSENTEVKESELYSRSIKLLIISLVLISFSYTIPLVKQSIFTTAGSMSSVHTASAFGGSILFASVCLYFFELLNRKKLQFIASTGIAIYLSLLVCYNILIQKDYVQSWKNQTSFWTDVKNLSTDVTDNTLIFVIQAEGKRLPQTKYIQSNSWTDPIIFRQIYQFPEYWKKPPRVFLLNDKWENKIEVRDNMLEWKVPQVTWDAHNEFLPDSNVIILKTGVDKKLSRDYSSLEIKGKILNLRPKDSPEFKSWKKGVLYNYLIEEN